jgi:mRNA-degrading endonuclease RelE of RelBE toxin-antitoxin system
MPFTISLKRSAEKELKDLPAKIHDKIITALLSLRENPYPRKAKRLHGHKETGYESAIIEYFILLMTLIKK